MEVLSTRTVLRCSDLDAAVAFWTDVVGLRLYREFGAGGVRLGAVLFCGGGCLELTGTPDGAPAPLGERVVLWLQVPDVDAEAGRLGALGVDVDGPRTEPWGLREAWFTDPEGLAVVLVEVPEGHPIRSRIDP